MTLNNPDDDPTQGRELGHEPYEGPPGLKDNSRT
jgi:hypothetical protein